METAKVLDIAIVDLSYEDKNSCREEDTESMADEISMEDNIEPIDNEMISEYAFV